MSKKPSYIPDEAIQQIYGGQRIWYRLATNPPVTVTSGKNKQNQWTFVCHSCADRNDSCIHTRSVRRFCNQPMAKTTEEAA